MNKTIKIILFSVLALALVLVFAVNRGERNRRQEETGEPAQVTESTPAPTPAGTPEPEAENTPAAEAADATAAEPEDGWEPDFTFTTVDSEGREWTDRCFADAELTMLNFWAYWCGPCVGEMPDLQKLYETYADRGFQIFGVSLEEYEKDNTDVMENLGITYPCLRMTESLEEKLSTGYIPTTLFVDGEGHVLGEVQIGSKSYSEWAAIVEGFLG